MLSSKKKNNSIIWLYLFLCILLNYLLLNYLYNPKPGPNFINPQYQNHYSANEIHITREVNNVPTLSQLPLLPTGCEAAAVAMFLQWAGIDVTMAEIADGLPKGQLPSDHNGELIGGNPNYEFVGNPFSTTGFGVFNQPISDVINHYLPDQSSNMTGCSFEELFEVLDSNRPLIIWATINMKEPTINCVWHDVHGNEVIWKTPEHALVLVGYNETDMVVNDPLIGKKVAYNKATFKKCWEGMGRQAITIKAATP